MVQYDLNLAEQIFGKSFNDNNEFANFIYQILYEKDLIEQFLDKQELIWRKENVAKDGREMFNEVWKDVTDEYKDRIKHSLVGTENISLGYVADVIKNEVGQDIPNECENKHQIIYLHGGKNGNGNWQKYLEDIKMILEQLIDCGIGEFENAYLVKFDIDVADDVWYIWIGVN